MPALVTRDVRKARHRVGARACAGMKQAKHRAARRASRTYCEAVRRFDDPDLIDAAHLHRWTTARVVADDDPNRCRETFAEWHGESRCIYADYHTSEHSDGCCTWRNDAALPERDEPRLREPRPLTGWEID